MLTILKIFFFFILLVFIGGFISRYLIGRYFRNIRDNIHNQYNEKQKERQKDGDVTINSKKRNKKHFDKDDGEYVDYEEVE
jgi:hypothetical protein